MIILVCVKQVPDTEETSIKLSPTDHTVVREGVASVMSAFDGYGVEAAARIKDADPETKIILLTMGPPQAKAVLKEGLGVAADKAYLLSDPVFAGSDALATGRILAEAVRKISELEGKIDLIICGKQSVDGETAITGPGIAEALGWPQLTCVLSVTAAEGRAEVQREAKGGVERVSAPLPCVVTFAKPAWEPRYATIKRKLAANRAEIPTLTAADLPGASACGGGLAGATIRVTGVTQPQKKERGVFIKEETGEDCAKKLFALLSAAGAC